MTATRHINMAFDPAAHADWLSPHLSVVKPAGPGPFPVVVQMHGCGGVQPLQSRYARAANAAGVAAVIVDSLAPRGISRLEAHLTVCSGLRLRGAERANDLVAVLHWLEAQTWADPRQVAAIGWSHGAWSIMEALAALPKNTPPGDVGVSALKLTALFYPYAGPPARTHRLGWGLARPRVFACLGGRDAVVGQVAPRAEPIAARRLGRAYLEPARRHPCLRRRRSQRSAHTLSFRLGRARHIGLCFSA